jgi:hypothetical protein
METDDGIGGEFVSPNLQTILKLFSNILHGNRVFYRLSIWRFPPKIRQIATKKAPPGLLEGLFAFWGAMWGSNPRHPEPQS